MPSEYGLSIFKDRLDIKMLSKILELFQFVYQQKEKPLTAHNGLVNK